MSACNTDQNDMESGPFCSTCACRILFTSTSRFDQMSNLNVSTTRLAAQQLHSQTTPMWCTEVHTSWSGCVATTCQDYSSTKMHGIALTLLASQLLSMHQVCITGEGYPCGIRVTAAAPSQGGGNSRWHGPGSCRSHTRLTHCTLRSRVP